MALVGLYNSLFPWGLRNCLHLEDQGMFPENHQVATSDDQSSDFAAKMPHEQWLCSTPLLVHYC